MIVSKRYYKMIKDNIIDYGFDLFIFNIGIRKLDKQFLDTFLRIFLANEKQYSLQLIELNNAISFSIWLCFLYFYTSLRCLLIDKYTYTCTRNNETEADSWDKIMPMLATTSRSVAIYRQRVSLIDTPFFFSKATIRRNGTG